MDVVFFSLSLCAGLIKLSLNFHDIVVIYDSEGTLLFRYFVTKVYYIFGSF
jgi:hypothetical protein